MGESTATVVGQGSNFLHTRYDHSKTFIGRNRFIVGDLKNASGGLKTFPCGTVVSRDPATNEIVPFDATSINAWELIPVGILATTIEIPDTETRSVSVCNFGNVLENAVLFDNGADTFETVIVDQTVRDLIVGKTAGITLILGQELSKGDNDLG